MADVGNLTAKLTLDTTDFSQGVRDAQNDTNIFSDLLSANLATKAIGMAVDALKMLGEAAANTFKDAVSGFAEYEQLIGGVETLFKSSAGVVQEYANQAFQTAGLSANQYMSTVTSFSASLIQSLGGDTAAAAEMANQAIIDMADNANKMGTDMTSIQNAYQGFAKQNFTMLDNLKLGYGGTQQEMYRLMQDAAALDAQFAETAKFSIDSTGHLEAGFADIVEAIHIVQKEMDITGTTAKEANGTIEGSINQVKSAWQNLINNLGNNRADIKQLTNDFVKAVEQAWENIKPVAKQIIESMLAAAREALPKLLDIGIDIGKEIAKGILQGLATILMLPAMGILKLLDMITGGGVSDVIGRQKNESYYYRASGGTVQAGVPYMTGELGRELFIPATDGYIMNHEDTQDFLEGSNGITININGDVYDDARSMKQKVRTAVLGVLQEQVAYG